MRIGLHICSRIFAHAYYSTLSPRIADKLAHAHCSALTPTSTCACVLMSIKLAGGPTCARALPCVEPAGCTYTHARAMQFLYGRTYVRTDGRTHHVTTKFSRLHGLPYFFKYGAPLRGPSARWRSSANITSILYELKLSYRMHESVSLLDDNKDLKLV